MFDRIAFALTAPRRAMHRVADTAQTEVRRTLRSEVASLFHDDLEDFTRLAMARRARKDAGGMGLAA